MNKITRFFQNVSKSLFDLEFYKEIIKTPLSFSFKYLYFLLFLTAVINTLFFLPNLFLLKSGLPSFVKTVETTAKNLYPSELIINIKNGTLTTNVKEPLAIKLPTEFDPNKETGIENLIVIDTKANPADIKKYKTAILATKNAITYPEDKSYKIYLLEDIKQNVKIDKNTYENILNKIISYANYLPHLFTPIIVAIIIFVPPVIALFSFLGRLLALVFFTLLPFFLAKIMKKDLRYGETYRIAIHGSTVIILAHFLFSLLEKTSSLLKMAEVHKIMNNLLSDYTRIETWIFLIWICFVVYKINLQTRKTENNS